jgi:hypothetical protein
MRRREFVTIVAGAAAWPLAARAQQPKIIRLGYLEPQRSTDAVAANLRRDHFLAKTAREHARIRTCFGFLARGKTH